MQPSNLSQAGVLPSVRGQSKGSLCQSEFLFLHAGLYVELAKLCRQVNVVNELYSQVLGGWNLPCLASEKTQVVFLMQARGLLMNCILALFALIWLSLRAFVTSNVRIQFQLRSQKFVTWNNCNQKSLRSSNDLPLCGYRTRFEHQKSTSNCEKLGEWEVRTPYFEDYKSLLMFELSSSCEGQK